MTQLLFIDATSANEAVNLQNRLRTLSSGLVGLRNSIHDQQQNGSSTMDVAVTVAGNGLNRIQDSGSPLSPLNPDPTAFPTVVNDGGVMMNGNGRLVSTSSIPPLPAPSSAAFTTTTGFFENGANSTQQEILSQEFTHGKLQTMFIWQLQLIIVITA